MRLRCPRRGDRRGQSVVSEGRIVTLTDRYEGDKSFKSDGRRLAWNGPVAILADRVRRGSVRSSRPPCATTWAPRFSGSAPGRRAVRTLLPLQHGDGLYLATGKYLSPSGKEWHGQGIQPDVSIEGRPTDEGDPQQKKAIDYLRGQSLSDQHKAA